MSTGTAELEERRSRLEAARDALTGLDEALAGACGDGLGELMELLDEVAARASAARVVVALEAVRRGEAAGSATHRHDPDPDTPLGVVRAAVRAGEVEAHTGCAVLRETTRLAPLLQPAALLTATAGLVALAAEHGPSVMRRLRPRLLAEHGHDDALEDLHTRLAAAARLSMPHIESADLTEYQLWMTPEQAATLEAAIGPLSAPAPDEDTGEPDLRPAGQRRVEALTAVCVTATTLHTGTHDTDLGPDTTLHLTIPLADLTTLTALAGTARGVGTVLATTADGTLLPPESVRRLGCDATLVAHRRLWATVRERPDEHGHHVTWDLTRGSYDQHLATLRHPLDDRASPAA